ncbi:MAG: hypothetical protein UV82_C0016G0018 [Candidatus Magasanikbacteria bacterium GW2011_GWD2_43_18]|nr:MAG: hypothetical protein UV18_C0004G0066 [Candidatus Magasanikbacteria bacterium GW2011_GWC2_42_27]KKT03764.1 MAG: hypothetical protein UV82_C0016G0018 [Candidatus Magasanikbacteria bacterium GW2011_GWD2_43_18]HBB38413.1 hypothetical protein [Candidatus Magasanikbacteria bacterium]HCC14180.1 hypothetical protein [Candidatus Magasanikbacteria bacterium]HCM54263.1 hypothetical protein [Candidatus Magasanikbacteria bacterium]
MPEKITEHTFIGDVLYEWDVEEYEQHDRGTLWHVLVISVGILLVIYALATDNFLFAVIIILAAIILFLQSAVEPNKVSFAIADLGIVLGNRFYTYDELRAFYIIFTQDARTLFFDTKSAIRPDIRVPLKDADPMEVRFALQAVLDEDLEKEEPFSDRAARRWKMH